LLFVVTFDVTILDSKMGLWIILARHGFPHEFFDMAVKIGG